VNGYRRELLFPILASQSINAFELSKIASHDDQTSTAGMTGDLKIVRADRLAASLQNRPNIGRMSGRVRIERQTSKCAAKR
jgi:hypothetical protein